MSAQFVVTVAGISDLEACGRDWRALEESDPTASVFQSWNWVSALIKTAPRGSDLRLVRARRRGETVGLGIIGIRRRSFLGGELRLGESGDPALDGVCVEYNDFLVAGGATPVAATAARTAMIEALITALPYVRSFVFQRATDELRVAAARAARQRVMAARVAREDYSHAVALSGLRDQGADFLESVSANTRRQIARAMQIYEKRGPLSLEVVKGPDRARAWSELRRLHTQSWKSRGVAGAFAGEPFRRFHARFLQDETMAELCRIKVGGVTLGVLYNLRHRGRVANYQSGFRYEADNRLKPGLVCHSLAAKHYLGGDCDVYDLLGGGQRFKRSLGAEGARLSTIVLEREGAVTTLLRSARSARKAFRDGAGALASPLRGATSQTRKGTRRT